MSGVGASGGDVLATQRKRAARIRASQTDVQVPPEDVEAIGRLVGGPFEGQVVRDLDHLLRPGPGSLGPRGDRRAVRRPVSPKALGLVTGWVAGHWGRAAASAAS